MAIDAQISELNADLVDEIESTLAERLQDVYPQLDLNRGRVLRDLLLRPAAIFHALNNLNVDKMRRSSSLAAIEADPALADADTVDNVLSNFLISRKVASKTTGRITIVVEDRVTTPIVAGTTFTTSSGATFTNVETFTGVTNAELVIRSTDKLLRLRSDNKYAFTIDVQAIEAGAIVVSRDSRFSLSPAPIRLADAYAEADFLTGVDAESTSALIARLRDGITTQAASGRSHIEAMLKEQGPSVSDVSIVGFGDQEMLRDRHNVFALSHGGKADLYVRTAATPSRVTITKSALFVSRSAKTWRVNFVRGDVPACYRVESVLREDSAETGSLPILSDVRDRDVTGDQDVFTPTIVDAMEGVYSAFQTVEVVFQDEALDVTDLIEGVSRANYVFSISYMPFIADVQAFISSRARRAPQADYLVRAPMPCFVGVNFTIDRHELDPDLTASQLSAMQSAIADRVNAMTFSYGRLSTSELVELVQGMLPARSTVRLPFHVWGTIRKPDGVNMVLHATDALEAPNIPEMSISNRTVAFFLRPEDVSIEVQTLNVRDV